MKGLKTGRLAVLQVVVALLLMSSIPLAVYSFSNGQSASISIGVGPGLLAGTNLEFDSHGDLWVSEPQSCRVVEYSAPLTTGESGSVVIGVPSLSDGCFSGNNIQTATANTMYDPHGLMFDSRGDLWVADSSNNRVLEFTPPFSTGESAALVIGQSDFTIRALLPGSSGLNYPVGLAFDPKGNLWVADRQNFRVLEFPAPFSNGESASIVIGQSDLTTFNSGTAPNATNMEGPNAVAFDPRGNLWVADPGNNRVLEYSPPFTNHETASLVIGQESYSTNAPATSSNGLHSPLGLVSDPGGNIWVADNQNNRVLEFDAPFTNGESASVVIGQPDLTSNSGANTPSGLNYPQSAGFDLNGNLWVADTGNSRVLGYVGAVTYTTSSTFTSSSSTTSTPPVSSTISTSESTASSATSSTASSSSSSSGIPEFPPQALLAGVLVVAVTLGYIALRRLSIRPHILPSPRRKNQGAG